MSRLLRHATVLACLLVAPARAQHCSELLHNGSRAHAAPRAPACDVTQPAFFGDGAWVAADTCHDNAKNAASDAASRLSRSRRLVYVGGEAKRRLCTLERAASALAWLWRTPDCVLAGWDASALRARFANKTVVFAGDSLTEQAVAAFLLLAEAHGHAIAECSADVRARFGALAHVATCVRLDGAEAPIHIVQVVVKLDLVDSALRVVSAADAAACRASVATNASAAWEAHPADRFDARARASSTRFCYADSWLSAAAHADVLVLNYGLWYMHYDRSGERYAEVAGRILDALRAHFSGAALVFVGTTGGFRPRAAASAAGGAGVVSCADAAAFLPATTPLSRAQLAAAPRDEEYDWARFAALERLFWSQQQQQQQRNPWRFVFLDVHDAMSMRVDAHVDCVHYCPVGPMLWLARFTAAALLQSRHAHRAHRGGDDGAAANGTASV
jgi:hypothetical protein